MSNNDYSEAIAYLSAADQVLGAVIAAVGPCELSVGAHGFRTLVEAIVSQQISIQAAATIMARLEAGLGELSPQHIVATGSEALRPFGLSGQKARYLYDLAEHCLRGVLDLAALPDRDDQTVIRQLTAVKGIGLWTAEIYLIFALGRLDVFPADDLGLRYAVQQFYDLPEPPPARDLRVRAEPWRPYRSIAAWYLWRGRRVLSLR